jgi:hypothetical protein
MTEGRAFRFEYANRERIGIIEEVQERHGGTLVVCRAFDAKGQPEGYKSFYVHGMSNIEPIA